MEKENKPGKWNAAAYVRYPAVDDPSVSDIDSNNDASTNSTTTLSGADKLILTRIRQDMVFLKLQVDNCDDNSEKQSKLQQYFKSILLGSKYMLTALCFESNSDLSCNLPSLPKNVSMKNEPILLMRSSIIHFDFLKIVQNAIDKYESACKKSKAKPLELNHLRNLLYAYSHYLNG